MFEIIKNILGVSLKEKSFGMLIQEANDWNGYVREEATRILGNTGNPLAIPTLIHRLNDWVLEVREQSQKSLLLLMTTDNVKHFIDSLPLLYKLKEQKRGNHNIVIDKITSFLRKSNHNKHLKLAIKDENCHVARIAMSLCIEHHLFDEHDLEAEYIHLADDIIRYKATLYILNKKDSYSLDSLDIMLNDRYMPIRRIALQKVFKNLPKAEHTAVKKYLLDKHIAIREMSIHFFINKQINVKNIYLDILQNNKQTVKNISYAISGLTYLGIDNLEAIVLKYIKDLSPTLRKVSLQALVKLSHHDMQAYLMDALADKSSSVSKEAARLIITRRVVFSYNELINIVEKCTFRHNLLFCIKVSANLSKWGKLIFLFSTYIAISNKDYEVDYELSQALDKWDDTFNRDSTKLTNDEKVMLIDLYPHARDLFGKSRGLLKFTLKSCGVIL